MAEPYLRQQALAHLGLDQGANPVFEQAGLELWFEPPRRQYALRGDGADKSFAAAVRKACDLALPLKANTVSGDGAAALLWLGPDEWLYSALDTAAKVDFAGLETALEGVHNLVSEVSCSRAVLGLAGAGARELLMQGTSLDLHPKHFGPGQCAQTAFARCHLLLQPVSDTPAYHLYVHRSFADYLYRWLLDAAGRLESPG